MPVSAWGSGAGHKFRKAGLTLEKGDVEGAGSHTATDSGSGLALEEGYVAGARTATGSDGGLALKGGDVAGAG